MECWLAGLEEMDRRVVTAAVVLMVTDHGMPLTTRERTRAVDLRSMLAKEGDDRRSAGIPDDHVGMVLAALDIMVLDDHDLSYRLSRNEWAMADDMLDSMDVVFDRVVSCDDERKVA